MDAARAFCGLLASALREDSRTHLAVAGTTTLSAAEAAGEPEELEAVVGTGHTAAAQAVARAASGLLAALQEHGQDAEVAASACCALGRLSTALGSIMMPRWGLGRC